MSSHHIVRENQEPALLVEDFYALSEEYLGQLLEWSPSIICDAENLDFFLVQGIKVDFCYADKDVLLQEETKIISARKDFLSDSLDFLVKNNYKVVNILAKECYPIFLNYAKDINIVVFASGIRYVTIQSHYEKWKAKGHKMFIEVSQIKSFNGIRYIDGNTFEVEQDGFVVLEMNSSDYVFIGEEI